MKLVKHSANKEVAVVQHQGEDVGMVYMHRGRRNAHVLVFASALAENWVRGNPWLQEELRTRLRTDYNHTGTFTTLSREEESTVREELKSRILSAGLVTSKLLTDSDTYVTEAMHEALAGDTHVLNQEVIALVRGYLANYFL